MLKSPFCHVPHDAVVPGALTLGDLGTVAAVVAPRPLRLEALVDGRNRPASRDEVAAAFVPARAAYATAKADGRLRIEAGEGQRATAAWLLEQLR